MMKRKGVLWLILAGGLFAFPGYGQKLSGLTASVVMQNVERGFEGVQDFIATIEADVDMERVRMPKMTATLYFKKPDKVHVASPSFAMLPREGIVLNPAILRERYDVSLQGKETIEGRECHKLQLDAKETRIRPKKLMLWIDPVSWTIAKMESAPYQGRFLRLDMKYSLHGEGIWLPQMLVASFEAPARDTTSVQLDLDMNDGPRPDEQRRPPRSGKITVRYLDYKVNVGVSDNVFEKKDPGQKPN